MEDRDFAWFVQRVKERTAIDLSLYKETQMKRRLTTLRMKHGYGSFEAFWEAMQKDKALMGEFLDRMTINVSEFWRNPGRWETLRQRFLPEMLAQRGNVSIWSAACSTGEEPYTLAMLLSELGALGRASILATDLDAGALEKAERGVYHERSVREVPPDCLQRYFRKESGCYVVDDALKRAITFRRHNLLEDRFGGPYDLIVCRNVMIYFTDEAKNLLYRKFAEALRPGGLLFVGSTEQIFGPGQYGLETADTFFYRRLRA
ncbi:protein-glutamate O-methyltransferase CheR [Paenibacillus cisolokensis]|uniref:CheR family methyltransferase n=1 Tax=Paenibacillus cisolokensis TaxID=1658519 RepID=UPI003D2D70CA